VWYIFIDKEMENCNHWKQRPHSFIVGIKFLGIKLEFWYIPRGDREEGDVIEGIKTTFSERFSQWGVPYYIRPVYDNRQIYWIGDKSLRYEN
jgi:hypothetical protein